MTFQKVTVSFTVSRVVYSDEGPSYNQLCILSCLSVLSKTPSFSQLQGHDFTSDPHYFTQEDKKEMKGRGHFQPRYSSFTHT